MVDTTRDIRLLPPGLLAYIGDSIYEIQARTWLVEQGYFSLNKIHQAAIELVNASAQARGLKVIQHNLTEEEADIVRRGRNYRTGSMPANADKMEYRLSTGLEALFGYLYLSGDLKRIDQLWGELVDELSGEIV